MKLFHQSLSSNLSLPLLPEDHFSTSSHNRKGTKKKKKLKNLKLSKNYQICSRFHISVQYPSKLH